MGLAYEVYYPIACVAGIICAALFTFIFMKSAKQHEAALKYLPVSPRGLPLQAALVF